MEVSLRRKPAFVRALALVFVLAAASACSPSDDDKQNSTGGTGGVAGSGGTGTGGTGGDPGTGGTGGDGGTGGTGGTGGDGGTGGTGGDPGTGGTGGDPGTGGTGGDPGGTGGTGGKEDPDPVVVRVAIDPPTISLVELDRLVLTAKAYDANDVEMPGLPVSWKSSNQAIVRVAADGSVFAASAGVATITATIEDVEAQADVTVTAGVVAGVSVEAPTAPVTIGDSVLLTALVTDAQERPLQGRTIEWSSSDPLLATVDHEGVVTGLLPGTVTITAEVDGVEGQVDVDVYRAAGTGSRRLATGVSHTCYLDDEGAAWCWGANLSGQLGDGTFQDRGTPVPVDTDLTFVSLAAGDYWTCALTEASELYCWGGDNSEFLGGRGDSPVPVLLTPDPYSFVGGEWLTGCALNADGHAYCWGYNSWDHEMGNETTESSPIPLPVAPPFEGGQPLSFVELKGGWYHACGLTVDSRLFCWGYNIANQLGQGWTDSVDHPVEVLGGEPVTAFGTSHYGSCATAGGTSYCWGQGESGQLGDGTSDGTAAFPVAVHSGGVAYVDYAGGRDFMCALDPFARAWCWGSNDSFALGNDGGSSSVPVAVSGDLAFSTIFAGGDHVCGIAYSGGLYCWGINWSGQLGIGFDEEFVATPTLVQW